jgi:RNA polymerase-binding transcription factor DksA
MPPMTIHDTRRAQLKARLDALTGRLRAIDDELDTHTAPDWEEQAVLREEDEVLEGLGQSGMQEIRRIHAALARIDAGEYGICVRCGNAIADERLDVLPDTPFCRHCAR